MDPKPRRNILGRTLSLLLSALALAAMAFGPVMAQPPPQEFFLSTWGNDATGDGSIDNPFATVPRALSMAGDGHTTVSLLPGEYHFGSFVVNPWSQSPNAALTIRSFSGKETVKIVGDAVSTAQVTVLAPNVTIKDIWFVASAQYAVAAFTPASNFTLEGCFIHQRAVDDRERPSLLVHGTTPRLKKINFKDNILFGAGEAGLEIEENVDFIHFFRNTVLLRSRGVAIEAEGDYSGLIVDNNILHFLEPAQGGIVLPLRAKGQGTRINLNCLSYPYMGMAPPLSNRLVTNSLAGANIPFASLNPEDSNAGLSLRGTCFDIYAQERMGALKPAAGP